MPMHILFLLLYAIRFFFAITIVRILNLNQTQISFEFIIRFGKLKGFPTWAGWPFSLPSWLNCPIAAAQPDHRVHTHSEEEPI
jgi:hypothetical protein